MKTLILIAGFILSVSSANAQSISTSISGDLPKAVAPKTSGVRVALTYSSLTATAEGGGLSKTSDLGSGLGASVGYAHLPVRKLGYLASLNVAAIDVKDSTSDVNFARLEANGAYAFNPRTFLKAGVNVSDITNADAKVKPGFGGQLGLGVRTTPTIGFDVSFISMNQTNTSGPVTADISESGLELGVSGTF